jgi:hypothetical protein
MAYSRWIDSFWFTSQTTDGNSINDSKLFINPRKGEGQTFTYRELKGIEQLDADWVARTFPEAPMQWLTELLRFIHIYFDDMENNVYRYNGYKLPTSGEVNDKQPTGARFIIDRRSDSAA